MNTMTYKIMGAILLGALTLGTKSLAAEEAPQPYHIEVVVFERLATAYDAPEYWRKDFALAYPPNYRLIAPAFSAPLNSDESESSHNLILGDTGEGISTVDLSSQPTQRDARALPERPAESYQLGAQAQSINRKSQMRVLFHKAWQQALIPTEAAPFVVVTGGEAFDNVHELGGTIRFSVNKYIHVDTQLWLTQFGPNYGQASEWPIIPQEPTFAKTPVKQAELLIPSDEDIVEYGINQATVGKVTTAPSFSGTVLSQGNFNNVNHFNKPFTALTPRQFLANEVIVLEQSRRMRSRELHYIDHPRLGLLIKIIPLSFEEAAKLAPNSDAM